MTTINLRTELMPRCDKPPIHRRAHFLESEAAPGNRNLVATVTLRQFKTEPHGILLEHCANTLPAVLAKIEALAKEITDAGDMKAPKMREVVMAALKNIVAFGDAVEVREAFKEMIHPPAAPAAPNVPHGTNEKKDDKTPAFDPFSATEDSPFYLDKYATGYLIVKKAAWTEGKPHLMGTEGCWRSKGMDCLPFGSTEQALMVVKQLEKQHKTAK